MTSMLFRGAQVGSIESVDVRIAHGRVTEIGSNLPVSGSDVVAADGGALIPGLVDHHLHLHAMAADAASVRCGPPAVRTSGELAAALARTSGGLGGWVRGVGYIETVAGELTASTLDEFHPARPVRVQHRSGALWMLNTVASRLVGLAAGTHPGIERSTDGTPTGRLWRADGWLRDRLPTGGPPDLADIGSALKKMGITSVTDATPDLSPTSQDAIVDAVRTGALPQRVHLLGSPIEGPVTHADVTTGPFKIVLSDSHPTDPDDLAELIGRAHRAGRAIAAHCVSRENLLILLAALDQVGAARGDRVEHAALVPAESISQLAHHGLTVVTQPGFIADRGDDYLHQVEPRDLGDLYRCRSLLDGLVPVALSSDAPYGPSDPWAIMRAAVERRTASGDVVGGDETLSAAQALAGFLAPSDDPAAPPRTVHVGAAADLVLLHVPLKEALRHPCADAVRTTVICTR